MKITDSTETFNIYIKSIVEILAIFIENLQNRSFVYFV